MSRELRVPPPRELLERAFAASGVALRVAAARLAGALRLRGCVEPLRRLLAEPSPLLAASAAIALGLLGDRDTLVLVRRLVDAASVDEDAVALLHIIAGIDDPLAPKILSGYAEGSAFPRVRKAASGLLRDL